ncbi:MAG: hypothetical protein U0990_04675 [Candidatus Nanopelagicales bacterium]|nr:hypothetical protein [Candidatus Nanopelagicales bacterium]MDZ4249367.1 hypothetical protein [Candidatus Nanopelagicales bacterium]
MKDDQWRIRFVSSRALKEWNAAKDREPGIMESVEQLLRHNPRDRSVNSRRLGPLAHRTISFHGKRFKIWQYEMTSGGRIWYLVDDDTIVVIVTSVSLSHPRKTD